MREILRALNRLIIHMATIAFFDLRNIVTCSKVDNRIYKRIQDNPFINLWRNSHKLNFSMKSLTLSCLMCALNLFFAQKLLRKVKNWSRLLKPQKVAPKAKRCPNVAEHNRDRPTWNRPFYICELYFIVPLPLSEREAGVAGWPCLCFDTKLFPFVMMKIMLKNTSEH